MTNWVWILLAGLTAYLTKLVGYLLPKRVLESKTLAAVATPLTLGLLTALTVTSAFSSGQLLAFDSRLLALFAAIVALRFKLPFIVVIVMGALVAALGRLAGLP